MEEALKAWNELQEEAKEEVLILLTDEWYIKHPHMAGASACDRARNLLIAVGKKSNG